MGKEKALALLDKSLKDTVENHLPTDKEGVKKLDGLLDIGLLHRGKTTGESRLQMQAILLAAVGQGMPLETAETLKELLRKSPPGRTNDLLNEINKGELHANAVLEKFMVEAHVNGTLVHVDPTNLQDVTIGQSATVPITPNTAKNMEAARAINFTVKSIMTEGAANQAPDVLRTGGRNVLLYEKGRTGKEQAAQGLKEPPFSNSVALAAKVDEERRKKGVEIAEGEYFTMAQANTQTSAMIGTGKCGEHAMMSFALLSDPGSLKKLGVNLGEGTQVISSLGFKIDHNYVLIAEPGAVTINDATPKRFREVVVNDPTKVVVVDPWMPIPTAHTLDRCNHEIAKDSIVCKMAVEMRNGKPVMLDNGGVETELPTQKVPVVDQLHTIQEHLTPLMHKEAMGTIVPLDEEVRLAEAAGRAVSSGKKPYDATHLSTDTPHDLYQCVDKQNHNVGEPTSYFFANENYLEEEQGYITQARKTSIESIAFDQSNMDMMPPDVSTRVGTRRDEQARQKFEEEMGIPGLSLTDKQATELHEQLDKVSPERVKFPKPQKVRDSTPEVDHSEKRTRIKKEPKTELEEPKTDSPKVEKTKKVRETASVSAPQEKEGLGEGQKQTVKKTNSFSSS